MATDFFFPSEVFVWLRLDPNDGVDEWGDEDVGIRPEWLDYELDQNGWEQFLGIDWGSRFCLEGESTPFNHERWLLDYGLAPKQPFLLWVEKPYYSRSYEGEYDVDIDTEVVAIENWSAKRAARAWETVVRHATEDMILAAKRHARLQSRRLSDKDAMYLSYSPYWSNYYDEAGPDSVRVSLCSEYCLDGGRIVRRPWQSGTLVSAESTENDYQLALERLAQKASNEIPGLSVEEILRLPRRHQ